MNKKRRGSNVLFLIMFYITYIFWILYIIRINFK